MRAVAFSPDSRRLATANQNGEIRVWWIAGGREETRLVMGGESPVTMLGFGDGGRTLLAVSQTKVVVFDIERGLQLFVAGDRRRRFDAGGWTGDRIAASGLTAGSAIWRRSNQEVLWQNTFQRPVTLAPDGSWAVTAELDGKIRLIPNLDQQSSDRAERQLRRAEADDERDTVQVLRIGQTGSSVVAGYSLGKIAIWTGLPSASDAAAEIISLGGSVEMFK